MTENKQRQIHLYKVVDVTENSGIQVDYRSRWSTRGDRRGGVSDASHLNFDEFAENLLSHLKKDAQVINGLPLRYITEQSYMKSFQLIVEGKVVRSYEPLSGEELRELQKKVLEKIVTEEAKVSS